MAKKKAKLFDFQSLKDEIDDANKFLDEFPDPKTLTEEQLDLIDDVRCAAYRLSTLCKVVIEEGSNA